MFPLSVRCHSCSIIAKRVTKQSVPVLSETFYTSSTSGGKRWFGTDGWRIEGVDDDVARNIHDCSHQPQTSVSLQTLMKTGRGELIHKTYKDASYSDDSKVATDKILMQVHDKHIIYMHIFIFNHCLIFGCFNFDQIIICGISQKVTIHCQTSYLMVLFQGGRISTA